MLKVDILIVFNKMIKGSIVYGIIYFNYDDGMMDKWVEKIRIFLVEEKEMSVKLIGGFIIEKDMNIVS